MKTIVVSKSESFREKDTEDCRILMTDLIPVYLDSEYRKKSLKFYESQATEIVDALQAYLPSGTFYAVMRELCKRKACLLRVPMTIGF